MNVRPICPVCKHPVPAPDLPAAAREPLALAAVFGEGVFAAVARNTHREQVEKALQDHFATHPREEWVRRIVELELQVKVLEAAMAPQPA